MKKRLHSKSSTAQKISFVMAVAILQISIATWAFLDKLSLGLEALYFENHIDRTRWSARAYHNLALAGPRRCIGAPCYIVDVVPDPYQPRIFLSMLGLPASDIERTQRGKTTNVSLVDIRTGDQIVVTQSYSLVNASHGFALLLQCSEHQGNTNSNLQAVLAYCNNLNHQGNTALGSYYESQTYACDLPSAAMESLLGNHSHSCSRVQIDVILAPKKMSGHFADRSMVAHINLNGDGRSFYISYNDTAGGTPGLFNSVSRRTRGMKPFAWHQATGRGDLSARNGFETPAMKDIRISACLIGVDYFSVQHREVIQYYLSVGFDHIYLGVPQWPTSAIFNKTLTLLEDFVNDGSLSIIVSEYANGFIQPDIFKRNFTYAPQGHKSSFVNTCLLVARIAGDSLAFVGDMDELVEHSYGNKTTVGEAVVEQLAMRNISLQDTCAINLGSMTGLYHSNRSGFNDSARIAEKLAGLRVGTDSVSAYGKSISNVKRVLRAGLHSIAYCEALPGPGISHKITRPTVMTPNNTFRPDIGAIRTLHLTDSYRQRSAPWELKMAKEEGFISYYVRDFSQLVNSELKQRSSSRN